MIFISTRTRIAWAITCALAACPVFAQELEFPVSPSPVGSGARAAGMADAFVAIADDATAASWNPAGLVQLERPEISMVGSLNAITEEFDAEVSMAGSNQREHEWDVNFASLVCPLPWTIADRNVSVSVSYQKKYDLNRQFDVQLATPFQGGFLLNNDATFKQDGGLSLIASTLAFELTQRLSVGIAFNIWSTNFLNDSGWRQHLRQDFTVTGGGQEPQSWVTTDFGEYDDFSGENYSIGVMWNPISMLRIGARFDTQLIGKADYFRRSTDSRFPDSEIVQERRHISIPSTFAIGAAVQPNDRLTVSFDLSTTDWNDFYFSSEGQRYSLVDAHPLDNPDDPTDFDRTFTVRLGAEYVFLPKQPKETLNALWTLRGGFAFDQEPAANRPSSDPSMPGDGKPDDFYVGAIGAGVQLFGRVNVDAAYQLRYGNNVNADYIRGVPGFSEDVVQHRFLLSAVIYF